MKFSLDWLLIFLPITIGLEYFAPDQQVWIFLCACIAIIPLAGWMGRATEHLAERTSEAIGGLLNATFGNAAELIIALVALNKGLYGVVKASLTGSIIGNILLVLGLSILAGGFKNKVQKFNSLAAHSQSTLLLLSLVGLVLPAAYHWLAGPGQERREQDLSVEICVLLLASYALGLLFSLRTHRRLLASEPGAATAHDEEGTAHVPWSVKRSMTVLLVATALVALTSEILVGAVDAAADAFGMTEVFVGVIVVAIVGNAAEHSTAVLMALKNRMDLSLSIAIGSSIQIALFAAPVLVFVSYFVGPAPMNLVFTPAEVLAVFLSVLVVTQITTDGESHWMEGVQLLAVYAALGLMFYFLPEAAAH